MFNLIKYLEKKVFIIAEIGCNFENDLAKAEEMIIKAAEAGADAVKFQTFIAEKLASKSAEKFWDIDGCPGETQLEEFQRVKQLTLEDYKRLSSVAKSAGIIFFSSPEDEESADLLECLDMSLFKISSMNITHIPLLKHVAAKRKPMIISTGASTIGEIEEAIKTIKNAGNKELAILHCISNYPTKDENANLRMITHIKAAFPGVPVGYSDHTYPKNGEGVLAAAVALGARVIEKHFTFDNTRGGYDHEISVDYDGLKSIVTQIRRVENALGSEIKEPVESESKARVHARRSLVAADNICEGTVITREILEVKRPGTGIGPRFLDIVIGRKARMDISRDTVLQWDMV